MPVARTTQVAAGMPTRVTAAAARIVAAVRLAGEIRELTSAQTKTVATEPHVPGPGLRRPAPKKVAISVAQSGAAALTAESGGEVVTRRPRRGCLAALLLRCLLPETKSRMRRWPTFQDRLGGSARCKKGSLRRSS